MRYIKIHYLFQRNYPKYELREKKPIGIFFQSTASIDNVIY